MKRFFSLITTQERFFTTICCGVTIFQSLRVKGENLSLLVFTYFIEYEEHLLQCEVIQAENVDITYIHPKTTPLYHRDKDFIFSDKPSVYINQSYKLTQGKNLKKLITKLCSYYSNEKVFFSDNDTGEIFHNYMLWSDNFSIFEG